MSMVAMIREMARATGLATARQLSVSFRLPAPRQVEWNNACYMDRDRSKTTECFVPSGVARRGLAV
jgi:hypothetical protein